jgi:hypothetical protein
MKGKRYNAVRYDGQIHLNDQVNDCTMRKIPETKEGRLVMKAFAKAMNDNADEFKLVSRRIATASVHAASSLSITCASVFDTLEMVLLKAINADHWSARGKKEWNRIANALDHDYLAHFSPNDVDAAWKRLVRYGFVNSYQKCGVRLYELNLVESVEG